MISKNNPKKPYHNLGAQLKQLRENSNETLLDVSGAVEIDSIQLAKFESGQIRPSEDILLLLISHFNTKDELATRLWKLAGYSEPAELNDKLPIEQINIRHDVLVMPLDPRVIYSDKVQVMINDYGVVLSFMQSASPNIPSMPVSKIGMSQEHANSLLEVLKKSLEQSNLQAKNTKLPKASTDETPKN